jgi:hypothetical protein
MQYSELLSSLVARLLLRVFNSLQLYLCNQSDIVLFCFLLMQTVEST